MSQLDLVHIEDIWNMSINKFNNIWTNKLIQATNSNIKLVVFLYSNLLNETDI